MKTTAYLAAISGRYEFRNRKGQLGPASDYRISKLLGVRGSTISAYRVRGTTFDDTTALKVAKLLDLDPILVLADMHAERAKNAEVKTIWQGLAKATARRAMQAVAMVSLSTLLCTIPTESKASVPDNAGSVYYVKLRILRDLITRFFNRLLRTIPGPPGRLLCVPQ